MSRVSTVITVCLVALFLFGAGCRNFEPGASTLTYSFGEGGALKESVLRDLAGRFERDNPGTKIFLHSLPTTTDEQRVFYLSSLAAHSNFVDVFELDVIWTAEFAAADLLLDLSKRKGFGRADRARFITPLAKQATYDDRFYAAPYYATFGTLFYRRDLLERHGLQPPTTLEELVSQARQVGQAENISGFLWQARDYEGLACVFLEFYACHGDPVRVTGERVVLDPETTTRTLQFMFDMIHTHEITPSAVITHNEVDSTNAFREGRAVFMRNWNGAYHYVRERLDADAIGVARMPSSRGPITGGWLLAVNRRTEIPDIAVRFVQFMTQEDTQRLMRERRGQGPALNSLYSANTENPALPAAVAESSVIRPQSPDYFDFSLILTEEIRRVLIRENTVEEGASRIVSRTSELPLPERAGPEFPESNYMTRYRP